MINNATSPALSNTALSGLQIGSSLLGAYTKTRAAAKNAQAMIDTATNQYSATVGQMDAIYRQTNQQATSRSQQILRQVQKETSTMFATLNDAGISGNSTERLMQASRFAGDDDLTTVESERQNAQRQNYAQVEGAYDQYKTSINEAKAYYKKNRTSWSGLALQIGAAAVGIATGNPMLGMALGQAAASATN